MKDNLCYHVFTSKGERTKVDPFETLFNDHFHSVYHFVYYMVRNKSDAEDITQEIFIKIANSYDSAIEIEAKKAWIYTIARRTVIDFVRKKKTKKFLTFWKNHIPEDLDVADDRNVTPEGILVNKENQQSLYQLLDTLPEKMRTVLYLRYIQGMSVTEVADLLDMTHNNVSVIQNRALAKLKNMVVSNPFVMEEIK